jgi:hypothetical protein
MVTCLEGSVVTKAVQEDAAESQMSGATGAGVAGFAKGSRRLLRGPWSTLEDVRRVTAVALRPPHSLPTRS